MFNAKRSALGAAGALLLLAGCAGGGGSSPPTTAIPQAQMRQPAFAPRMVSATGRIGLPESFGGALSGVPDTSPGWLSDAAKGSGAKIYVSDYKANAVYIYDAQSPTKRIGTITNGIGGPLDNYVDPAGTLYVTNFKSNTVTVYPKGKTSPSATYSTGLSNPVGVIVGTDGTIYVSEYATNKVVEFDKGQTVPSRTISLNGPSFVTLDSKNNLYACYFNPAIGDGGSDSVDEFQPKATSGTDLGVGATTCGGLKLDKTNDLLIGDQNNLLIGFYKHGVGVGLIQLSGQGPYNFALNSTETLVYVVTFSTTVQIFNARPGGPSTGTIGGFQQASGVSLSPPPPFGNYE